MERGSRWLRGGPILVTTLATMASLAAPRAAAAGNRAPHANPGANQKVGIHANDHVSITLDGSRSSDPDADDLLTYIWRDQNGQVLNPDQSIPIVHLQLSAAGTYTFSLTVADPDGLANTNSMQVEVVLDYVPPIVDAADLNVGVTEQGGARGAQSGPLHAYLAGLATSATDNVTDPALFVDVEAGGQKADDNTLFPIGETPVTVKYADQAGNVGSATAKILVIDHENNDVFVPADSPEAGRIVILRVRGGASEPFCSPTHYIVSSEGIPVMLDPNGRVVFLAYVGFAAGHSWVLFRCTAKDAPPEAIAQFRNGDDLLDPTIPEPFPGQHFTNIGSLHLETLRSVAVHDGSAHTNTEDAYVMAARPAPGPHVEAVRYRVKSQVWEGGDKVPEPIQRGSGCCGQDQLPLMVSHGGGIYSSDGHTVRLTKTPLQIGASGTIDGIDFDLQLSLFGGTHQLPDFNGGTIIDDAKTPNIDSGCQPPPGVQASTAMPYPFHVFDGVSGLLYDEFTKHNLVGTSNYAAGYGAVATIGEELLDDDPTNDDAGLFTNPFLGCGVSQPVMTNALVPSFDPLTGVPNDVPPLATAPAGLFGVVGRGPIRIVQVIEPQLVVTATLPYSGLPGSIAAFPVKAPAASGTAVQVQINSPVDVMLTDPNGRRLGVENGQAVNDFGVDAFDSGPGEPRILVLRNPVAGDFRLQGIGTGDGPYTIHVNSIDLDRPFGRHLELSGTASYGSTVSGDFSLGAQGDIRFLNRAPVANAGADQTLDADASGRAAASLDGSLSGDPDGDALTYIWASTTGIAVGRTAQLSLPAGVNVVTLTVTDSKGATDSASVNITVNSTARDVTAPFVTVPSGVTSEAIGPSGAPVVFAASANDDVDGAVAASCTPASGSMFALGATTVACTASDSAGNTAHASFVVTVRDTQPPTVVAPPPFVVAATERAGARGTMSPALAAFLSGGVATDVVDAAPVRLAPQTGGADIDASALLPIGTTTVTFRFRDRSGNVGTATATVTVEYRVCALYDASKAAKSGSTIPVKVQVCDGSGANLSSPDLVLHAVSVTQASTNAPGQLADAGDSNPDYDFRYSPDLSGYIFNLSTKGMSTGTYNLNFRIGDSTTLQATRFQIK